MFQAQFLNDIWANKALEKICRKKDDTEKGNWQFLPVFRELN